MSLPGNVALCVRGTACFPCCSAWAHQRAEGDADDVLVLVREVVLDGVGDKHQNLGALVEQEHEPEVAHALRITGDGRHRKDTASSTNVTEQQTTPHKRMPARTHSVQFETRCFISRRPNASPEMKSGTELTHRNF